MKRVYLDDILEKKRRRLQAQTPPPSFYQALAKEGLSIIGEVKKASPSKGLIRPDFDPVALAKEYDLVVDAMSILTEEDYFLGSLDYLEAVFKESHRPLLCKDFILERSQIIAARARGASAILLIVHILNESELKDLYTFARTLGLDVLVETHTKEEVKRALKIQPQIIGVNNRNLKTFEVDLSVTEECMALIPESIVTVSESGIFTGRDIQRLKKSNIDAVLVGESFMRAPSIEDLAKELRKAYD